MSDYWSAAPADRMLAAHCRPKGKFGTSVKRAAADKKYHSPWRRKSKKIKRASMQCRWIFKPALIATTDRSAATIIDFPPTLPMTIVDECAFAFPLHRSYSQQHRPSLRRSHLGRRHLTDQSSSWSKDLSLRSTKTSLPPRPRLYLRPLLPLAR